MINTWSRGLLQEPPEEKMSSSGMIKCQVSPWWETVFQNVFYFQNISISILVVHKMYLCPQSSQQCCSGWTWQHAITPKCEKALIADLFSVFQTLLWSQTCGCWWIPVSHVQSSMEKVQQIRRLSWKLAGKTKHPWQSLQRTGIDSSQSSTWSPPRVLLSPSIYCSPPLSTWY